MIHYCLFDHKCSHAKFFRTSLANIIHGSNLDAEYAFMDARLKRIEDFIGASGVTDEMSKNINRMPIYEIVDDLHMRIQLLNPTHVDALYSRINQVLIKLQKVILLLFFCHEFIFKLLIYISDIHFITSF